MCVQIKTEGRKMSKVGYMRVSTKSQCLQRQLEQLEEYNVKKIFEEKVSGKNIEDREELKKLLNYIREDDEVVVISLDRLSRDNNDIDKIIQEINSKGATLTILDFPSFQGVEDPNLRKMLNNLVLEVFKFTAQNEREKIKERQRQGIAIAKREGKFKGRKLKYHKDAKGADKLVYDKMVELLKKKVSYRKIAKELGINVSTIQKNVKILRRSGEL